MKLTDHAALRIHERIGVPKKAVAPIAAVIGLIGTYYALPDNWQAAVKSEVREGDLILAQQISEIDAKQTARANSNEVCQLRAENRRLEIDQMNVQAGTPEGARYGLLLRQQIEANTYRLAQLGREGARCAR